MGKTHRRDYATLKFSFKLVTFSESYVRKCKWVFFLNTVYIQLYSPSHGSRENKVN